MKLRYCPDCGMRSPNMTRHRDGCKYYHPHLKPLTKQEMNEFNKPLGLSWNKLVKQMKEEGPL